MKVAGDAVNGALADAVSVSVEVPPVVTLVGLNTPVTPDGRSSTHKEMVSLAPAVFAVVTVYGTEAPCATFCVAGRAAIEKSFAAQLGNFTDEMYVSQPNWLSATPARNSSWV